MKIANRGVPAPRREGPAAARLSILWGMKRVRPIRAAVALALLLLCGPSAAGPVVAPAGAPRAPGSAEMAPHPVDSKTYNEVWTYQVRLNNHMDLLVNLSRGNFGSFKEPVCGANVLLVGFPGGTRAVAREYPKSNFSWDPAAHRLKVHREIWLEGLPPKSHRLHFATKKNGTEWLIDLEFSRIAPSLVPGNGVWKVNGHLFGQVIHVPWARVDGVVAVGGDTVKVSGVATMDHTWQDDMAPEIVSRTVRWRTFGENWETGYLVRPADGNEAAGYALRKGASGPEIRVPQSWKAEETARRGGIKDWPVRLTVDYGPGGADTLSFGDAWSRTSMLDEFEGVTRWAVKKFFGGEMVDYRGPAKVNGRNGSYVNAFVK